MHIAKLPNGYAEIKDDGTWTLHPVHFEQAGGDIIKVTYDSASGKVLSKEFYTPLDLETVDEKGNVLQVQRGFILEHEIVPPKHPEHPRLQYRRVPRK